MTFYSQTVNLHFNNPKNAGRIEHPDAEGTAGSPRGGPFFVFTARFSGDVIEEIKFQTYGCAPAIAAGSYLASMVQGKTTAEAREWDVEQLIKGLGGLPEEKRHCAELAIEALRKLLKA